MAKAQAQAKIAIPNDLEPYWMPFTANRAFKKRPRMIVGAKDMHYIASDGRRLLDGAAGLWCTNAGHNREPIVEAIQREAATLDYAPAFQFSHPKAFELASRVAALARETSITYFSATPVRKQSTPRSRSRLPTITSRATPRAYV